MKYEGKWIVIKKNIGPTYRLNKLEVLYVCIEKKKQLICASTNDPTAPRHIRHINKSEVKTVINENDVNKVKEHVKWVRKC